MKSAFAVSMRLLIYIMILIVCLFSNEARSEIRISEHLRDVVSEAVLAGFVEKTQFVLAFPVDGKVSSFFGTRRDPFHRAVAFHKGIDITHRAGSAVRAARSGRVTYAGWLGGCGNMCVVDHGRGLRTRYCHLHEVNVRQGQEVASGQRIGSMGATGRATGSHLHFEVRRGGVAVDPAEYLAF